MRRRRGARMIVGQEKPDGGPLRVGETAQLAYVDQSRTLDPDKSVYEVISEGMDEVTLGKIKMNARARCSRFAFSGADHQKKVSQLSGGERNRDDVLRRQLLRVRGV
jgi:sulfate-transporting ATPase